MTQWDMGVPSRFRDAVYALSRLGDEEASEILDALSSGGPYVSQRSIATHLEASSKMTEDLAADDLASLLLSVHVVRDARDASVQEVAEVLSGSRDLELESEDRDRLAQHLEMLMEAAGLDAVAKAWDVQTEHDRIFVSARILTDIRPVFGDDADQSPVGAVLVHTLRLRYQQDGDTKAFYLALDSSDLESVQKAVNRATEKAQETSRLVERAGLQHFVPEED